MPQQRKLTKTQSKTDIKSSAHPSSKESQLRQQVPPSVQAVLEFNDYPRDLVLSTYQQLSTGSLGITAQPGNEETEGASGSVTVPTSITAAMLMMTLDTILGLSPASRGSYSQSQDSESTHQTMMGGTRIGADVVGDCPPDNPAMPSSSESLSVPGLDNPELSNPAANTAETVEGSVETSFSSTPEILPSGTTFTNTEVPAGEERSVQTSPTYNTASSISRTGAAPVVRTSEQRFDDTLVSPTPGCEPALLEQRSQPNTSAVLSSSTCSLSVGVPESQSSPAEERAKERRRLLARLRALREENRQLKARQVCGHCRQKPVELTFLPCGHFVYCQSCGGSFDTCPVCKKTILADVRTFLC